MTSFFYPALRPWLQALQRKSAPLTKSIFYLSYRFSFVNCGQRNLRFCQAFFYGCVPYSTEQEKKIPGIKSRSFPRNLEDFNAYYKNLPAVMETYKGYSKEYIHKVGSELPLLKKAPLQALGIAGMALFPIVLPSLLGLPPSVEIVYVSWLLTACGGAVTCSVLQGQSLITNKNPLVRSSVPAGLGLAGLALPDIPSLCMLIWGMGWVANLETVYDHNLAWLRAIKMGFCLVSMAALVITLFTSLFRKALSADGGESTSNLDISIDDNESEE